MKTNSRRTAAFIVARWLVSKEYPSSMLPEGADRAFVQDLVYTTIRRFRPLGFVLHKLVAKMPKGEMEALLLVGVAQLLYMPDVAEYAAVSETVEAAKLTRKNAAGLVNGVLRNVIRRREELLAAIAAEPLEVRESFPTALVRRWKSRYDEESVARMCALYNEPAETYLARRDGFTKLARGEKVQDQPGFETGDFVVQDPGTAGAIELLDVKPGDRVLDACAAPGGKTIQVAWRDAAEVVACEVNPARRARLVENLSRCRLEGRVKVAGVLDGTLPGAPFDKVLVDAPCSNTGVFRRRPDARWNWNEKKLGELVALQAEILDKCVDLVAPGGTLVYSTCSVEPEENAEQVAAFLSRHPEFSEVSRRESLPFVTGHDGAFACALVKRAD